jgi:dienelactone hydrolase
VPWKCRRLYRVAPGVVNRAGGLPTRSAAAVVLALVGAAALVLLGFVLTEPGAAEIRARGGRLARADVLGGSAPASPVEELRLVSTSGLVARCAASAPAGARGRRPGFLIAAGYETGRRAVTFPQVADAVLVSCDYPLDIPEDLDAGDLWRRLPGLRREIVDVPATFLLALDYLARRPDVRPGAIGVVGASVGVPPATIVAALDPRASAAALLYGGGDLHLLFSENVDLGSGLANAAAGLAVRLLARPVEPVRYAGSIAPRPTLVVNAPEDRFIPRASAEALHGALREPKEIRWIPLDHFAAFHERELLAELTALAVTWFGEHGVG